MIVRLEIRGVPCMGQSQIKQMKYKNKKTSASLIAAGCLYKHVGRTINLQAPIHSIGLQFHLQGWPHVIKKTHHLTSNNKKRLHIVIHAVKYSQVQKYSAKSITVCNEISLCMTYILNYVNVQLIPRRVILVKSNSATQEIHLLLRNLKVDSRVNCH